MSEKLLEIAIKYPELPQKTIEEVFGFWNKEEKRFEGQDWPDRWGHPSDHAKTLIHEDIYKMFSRRWKGEEPNHEEAEDMKEHNRQLLTLLKDEFGWKEENEIFYPNPEDIS